MFVTKSTKVLKALYISSFTKVYCKKSYPHQPYLDSKFQTIYSDQSAAIKIVDLLKNSN